MFTLWSLVLSMLIPNSLCNRLLFCVKQNSLLLLLRETNIYCSPNLFRSEVDFSSIERRFGTLFRVIF